MGPQTLDEWSSFEVPASTRQVLVVLYAIPADEHSHAVLKMLG